MSRRPIEEKRPPTRQDRLQAELLKAATAAGVSYLRTILADNPARLLKTLQPHEAEGWTVAVLGAAVAKRIELVERERAAGFSLEQSLEEFDFSKGDSLEGVFDG